MCRDSPVFPQSKAKDMAKDVLRENPGDGERESKEAELHSMALLGQAAGPGGAL